MKIESSAFENNGTIPEKYTCDGENISPPLEFTGIPNNAVSLVLLMDDPDVPTSLRPDGMFDHWVVWNIPAGTQGIAEGQVPDGVEGKNTAGGNGYTGPCPPDREHRYFFKLYALDTTLELSPDSVKKDVEALMKGHVLEEAEIVGRYDRSR